MAFQRSYSKVWWGSDNQQLSSALALSAAAGGATANNDGTSFTSGGFYYGSYFAQKTQQQLNAQRLQCNNHGSGGYHSLDSGSFRSYVGNLSRIQEVDDEQNNSKLSWGKRDSPGSLRSQVSEITQQRHTYICFVVGNLVVYCIVCYWRLHKFCAIIPNQHTFCRIPASPTMMSRIVVAVLAAAP